MLEYNRLGIIIRRNRYTRIAMFALVLVVIFTSPDGDGTTKILFFTSAFLMMCISIYTVVSHIVGLYMTAQVAEYSVVSVSNFPNPGQTMMDHLEEKGINVAHLESLDFMVYSLSNGYIKTFVRQLKTKNPEIIIRLSGKGPVESETAELVNDVCETNHHLTRHKNIIKTKDGRSFVWFEPRHSVTYRNGKEFHSLPFGAFLLERESQ